MRAVAWFEERRPAMSLEEFRLLREVVYERCGIHLREELQFVLERRLWPRVSALGLRDFGEYHRFLKYDPAGGDELDGAIEALTTHETYFFREPEQLEAFSQELLPALRQRNAASRRLRLWSAGCSTGEEAYTLSMLIERSGLFAEWEVEIYATDISRRVLAAARVAEYGASALRATPPELRAAHFEALGDERYRVRPKVRARVSFGQLNLLDAERARLLPRCDAVFCRNVLIYLDVPARRRVVQVFHERLVEGGYLLLGHSENLLSVSTDFELVHLERDLVYRRPPWRRAP